MSKIKKNALHLDFKKKVLALAIPSLFLPHSVEALELSTEPPLPKSQPTYVLPNIIVSVDDSGSMGDTGIKSLKDALQATFSKDNIDDNKIRLAWQSMNKTPNIPDSGTNSMKILDASHRKNFLDWVNTLNASGGTPSHKMIRNAGDYLMRTNLGKNSPWAEIPGTKEGNLLGCRRSFHIFMTDGSWNSSASNTSNHIDADRTSNGYKTIPPGNIDGSKIILPDNQVFDPLENESLKIYTDNWGDYSNDNKYNINTLSDLAFYYWATDLQPSLKSKNIKENVSPIYNIENDETIVSGNKKVTFSPYWNPKNNPSTWRGLTTYTIGFGTATDWRKNSNSTLPQLLTWSGDTYKGSYNNLAVGSETWPSPFCDYNNKPSITGKRACDGSSPYSTQNELGNRRTELWHMAINSRGKFYAVKSGGNELTQAFKDILEDIQLSNPVLPGEIQASGSSSSYSIAENNSGIFVSGYNPKDGWTGWVKATSAVEPQEVPCGVYADEVGNPEEQEEVEAPSAGGGGAGAETCWRFPSVVGGWEEKTTAQRLDGLTDGYVKDSRLILGWNDATSTGASFKWSDDTETYMSTAQKALLGMTSSADGATTKNKGLNILNYVRGSNEFANSEVDAIKEEKPLRKRMSRQGDIVNSEIWYTGGAVSNFGLSGYAAFRNSVANRTPMLYVGGNDGMLHGFSAVDGTEKIAYVPRGVMGKLKNLADPGYIHDHKYYVDGSPMTGDIKTGNGNTASDWKTVLVGTLGLGGRGYFVLDVTNPSNFSEAQAAATVLLDKTFGDKEDTSGVDADIGAITAAPVRNPSNLQQTTQIARLNNGRWAVVMGNGYNSKNQRPALLVQYLDGNEKQLKVIPATSDAAGSGNAKDNGLSAPALVDLDGNGTPDIVYAGDNLGNLWKFDLLSSDDTKWGVAFNNNPLFTAKGPKTTGGNRTEVQPITTAPIVRANNRSMTVDLGNGEKRTQSIGGLVVAFGTGRNLTNNDRDMNKTQYVQTLYSVTDRTSYTRENGVLKIHPGDAGCTDNSPTLCVLPPSPIGTLGQNGKFTNGKSLAQRKFAYLPSDDKHRTLAVEDALNKGSWKNYSGWYVDFPDKGERLLRPMQFYAGTNILAVYSETPDGTIGEGSAEVIESCTPEAISTVNGKMVRSFINIMDGTAPAFQIVDYNLDGLFDALDKKVIGKKVPKGSPLLMANLAGGLDKTGGGDEALAPIPEQSMRPNWRQLQ